MFLFFVGFLVLLVLHGALVDRVLFVILVTRVAYVARVVFVVIVIALVHY